MIVALVIYSLAVVAFAGDFAFGRPKRTAAASGAQQTQDRAATLATVGGEQAGGSCLSRRRATGLPGTVAGDAPGARAAGAAMAGARRGAGLHARDGAGSWRCRIAGPAGGSRSR